MKEKLMKLKEDLQTLSDYKKDEAELKRVKDKLMMYVDLIFPTEKDEWHSKIWNINFAPRLISDGMFGLRLDQDRGEFEIGKQKLLDVIDLIIEKMDIMSIKDIPIGIAEDYTNNTKIFIVHGHDNETKEAVARLLEKLGLSAVILNEQANKGKTIIEKLEHYDDVGYAIVLLTPCDLGKAYDSNELKPRARQNVVAELGYFIAKLGRARVSVIRRGDTEVPSDFAGLGYIDYKNTLWQFELAKELKSVGYNIDLNKLY